MEIRIIDNCKGQIDHFFKCEISTFKCAVEKNEAKIVEFHSWVLSFTLINSYYEHLERLLGPYTGIFVCMNCRRLFIFFGGHFALASCRCTRVRCYSAAWLHIWVGAVRVVSKFD